jgi:hypothetical protein
MSLFNNPAKAAFQLFAIGALLVYTAATHADAAQDLRERQRVYQAERQRCLSGQTNQSQETCLREAGAVLQHPLDTQGSESAAQLQENARQRCVSLPDPERQSCVARMQGQGSVEGSAAGGGMLRELREPAQ